MITLADLVRTFVRPSPIRWHVSGWWAPDAVSSRLSVVKRFGPLVVVNCGPGCCLLAAALGAGGAGGLSAALPVGLLLAGPVAVLLGAAGSG